MNEYGDLGITLRKNNVLIKEQLQAWKKITIRRRRKNIRLSWF